MLPFKNRSNGLVSNINSYAMGMHNIHGSVYSSLSKAGLNYEDC